VNAEPECVNDACVPSRSGGFCLNCGRAFRDDPAPEEAVEHGPATAHDKEAPLEPTDPNYWSLLMHDIEIVAVPVDIPTHAGLAFYGKRPDRQRR
jgi:hypothetical protein